jgi:hypothetical protein
VKLVGDPDSLKDQSVADVKAALSNVEPELNVNATVIK